MREGTDDLEAGAFASRTWPFEAILISIPVEREKELA